MAINPFEMPIDDSSKADEDLDSEIDPLESILAHEPSPLPIGPDGGFVPSMESMQPEPVPPATEDTFICMRGPCRHFFEAKLVADLLNTSGTFDKPMHMKIRYCRRVQGLPINLQDEPGVPECNDWDPYMLVEIERRNLAREEYLERNPQYRKEKLNGN